MPKPRSSRLKHPTIATATFAPGGPSSAGRMKLRTGVHLCSQHCIVEGGRRITTAELSRSVKLAAERFLNGHRNSPRAPA